MTEQKRAEYFASRIYDPEDERKKKAAKLKVKYTCPRCATNLWGKPGVEIGCAPCGVDFEAVAPRSQTCREKKS